MIIREKDMSRETIEGNKGGAGRGEYKAMIPRDQLKDEVKFFNIVTLEPGASIGSHPHVDDYEVYYILDGKATVVDDGTEAELDAGDAIVTGDGKIHSIQNNSDAPLVFMACIVYANKA